MSRIESLRLKVRLNFRFLKTAFDFSKRVFLSARFWQKYLNVKIGFTGLIAPVFNRINYLI